jgi:hypothetical protein
VFPKLQYLNLEGASDVEALQGNFPHLTRLNLFNCYLADEGVVENLVKNLLMPALEELDLSSAFHTVNGIATMAEAGARRRWPQLRSLSMGGQEAEEDEDLWRNILRNYRAVSMLMRGIGPELRCPSLAEYAREFAEDPNFDLGMVMYDVHCWEKE